ncbi:hypothetical protein [Gymnodinialimonas hymeniacidonis]|uniref:hypothetical protein n=1 Tax=Gymnodinialimonas hymeniacidonis TaxID=3126508 RepID=UPI0034C672C5
MRYDLEVERQLLLLIQEAGTQRWTHESLKTNAGADDTPIPLYDDVAKRENDTLFHLDQMAERGFVRIWRTDAGLTVRLLRAGRDRIKWHRNNTPIRRVTLRNWNWFKIKFRTVIVPVFIIYIFPFIMIIVTVELMYWLGFEGR